METHTRHRLVVITLVALLFPAAEASAQIWRRARPRPPRAVPEDNRPTVGVTFGPAARTGQSDTTGVDVAIAGEIPLHDGLRGRAEIGASTWAMDPAAARGASRLTLTRGSLGLYRLNGHKGLHTFLGGGFGLYRHRVRDAAGSGTKAGIYGGVGMEYLGQRRGVGLEFRVNIVGTPQQGPHPDGLMAHTAALLSVKRVF